MDEVCVFLVYTTAKGGGQGKRCFWMYKDAHEYRQQLQKRCTVDECVVVTPISLLGTPPADLSTY